MPSNSNLAYHLKYNYWGQMAPSLRNHNAVDYKSIIAPLIKDIINSKNSFLAYQAAMDIPENNINIKSLQALILKNKDHFYGYLFARFVKGADIKRLQKMVMASGHTESIINFACHVKTASIKEAVVLALNSKKAKYAYMILKYTPDPDLSKIKSIILKSKKSRYLCELTKHLPVGKERDDIENYLILNKSNVYVRLAAQVNGADVKKFEKRIIATGNMQEMKKFAKKVSKSKLKKMEFLF